MLFDRLRITNPEELEALLLHFGCWSDGNQAVLAITGDIDSVTIQDLFLRILEVAYVSYEKGPGEIMKRILVTGAGGAPSTNFIRSLQLAPEDFYIVGADANKYYLMRAEVDSKYLVPPASDPDFLPIINEIIFDEGIEFIHIQNDAEIRFFSENRESVKAKLFLPPKETVRICQDKFLSYKLWAEVGLSVPETVLINNTDDLEDAFRRFGGQLWIRATSGAAGYGSLPASNFETATAWINFHHGWGSFSAAELLEPDSVTWMSIWNQGELVVAQGRKRLYWESSKVSPSGVTGITGGGVTISDPQLDEIALQAIRALDKKPHGIFSVDLTYDKKGTPNPTEINIGRFFTTHLFFTRAGLNMPYILAKLAYNEEPPEIGNKISPLRPGLVWIRGVDFHPVLVTTSEIESYVTSLERMKRDVCSPVQSR